MLFRSVAINTYIETGGLFTGILYSNNDIDYYSKLPGERGNAVIDEDLDISDEFDYLLEEFI